MVSNKSNTARLLTVSVGLAAMILLVAPSSSTAASLRRKLPTVQEYLDSQNNPSTTTSTSGAAATTTTTTTTASETSGKTAADFMGGVVPSFAAEEESTDDDDAPNTFEAVQGMEDQVTADMVITDADKYMMASDVPTFGQMGMRTDAPFDADAAEVFTTEQPISASEFEPSSDMYQETMTTKTPMDVAETEAAEQTQQDPAAGTPQVPINFDSYDSEDVFSAALLFTAVPTEDFSSEETADAEEFDIETRVVMPTDDGWQSGIVEWYDSASDNYGVLWMITGQTQIFGAGRDMNDMVRLGRDTELFSLGSMTLDEQTAVEDKNYGAATDDDKGTIIGLSIMGVAMMSLMIIAAVVMRRRSSQKRGKNISNLNSAFQDHEEFHDEPAKPPTGMFLDNEPAGFSSEEPEFLTVDGQIVEEGIAGLADTDLPLFPDNPELYRNAV